jgi:lipoprotein-anchoring transpeptidase ErfK/SrfK
MTMTMKSLLSKCAFVGWSASFSLLALSAQAATPPNERIPSLHKKATIETPAVKPTVTAPTAIPTEIPAVNPTVTPQASTETPVKVPVVEATAPAAIPTAIPTAVPAAKTTVTPQTPTVTPAKTPGAKTTAATTNTKTMATKLVLNLKERRVYAYNEDKVLMSYPVAVGKKGWETPTGNFKVTQMIKDPVWQNPWNGKIVPASPKGPIGERWIGFWSDGKNTIGFHGTPTLKSLGTAASHGCVRMRNEDVKVLFEVVQPGTPVVVVPK